MPSSARSSATVPNEPATHSATRCGKSEMAAFSSRVRWRRMGSERSRSAMVRRMAPPSAAPGRSRTKSVSREK